MSKKKDKNKSSQSGGGTPPETGITPPTMLGSMKRYAKDFVMGDKPMVVKIFVAIVLLMALVAAISAIMGKV